MRRQATMAKNRQILKTFPQGTDISHLKLKTQRMWDKKMCLVCLVCFHLYKTQYKKNWSMMMKVERTFIEPWESIAWEAIQGSRQWPLS